MIVCVEANIGAGKSAVLAALARGGHPTFPEPVHEWSEWLARYYTAPERWSLAFQLKVLMSFAKMREALSARHAGPTRFVERSPASCRGVFGQRILETGNWTPHEAALFDEVYAEAAWKPDLHVYLRVAPETCWERMRRRGRDAEAEGVSHEYLAAIHRLHESGAFAEAPVEVIDVAPEWTPEEVAERVLLAVAARATGEADPPPNAADPDLRAWLAARYVRTGDPNDRVKARDLFLAHAADVAGTEGSP